MGVCHAPHRTDAQQTRSTISASNCMLKSVYSSRTQKTKNTHTTIESDSTDQVIEDSQLETEGRHSATDGQGMEAEETGEMEWGHGGTWMTLIIFVALIFTDFRDFVAVTTNEREIWPHKAHLSV